MVELMAFIRTRVFFSIFRLCWLVDLRSLCGMVRENLGQGLPYKLGQELRPNTGFRLI